MTLPNKVWEDLYEEYRRSSAILRGPAPCRDSVRPPRPCLLLSRRRVETAAAAPRRRGCREPRALSPQRCVNARMHTSLAANNCVRGGTNAIGLSSPTWGPRVGSAHPGARQKPGRGTKPLRHARVRRADRQARRPCTARPGLGIFFAQGCALANFIGAFARDPLYSIPSRPFGYDQV